MKTSKYDEVNLSELLICRGRFAERNLLFAHCRVIKKRREHYGVLLEVGFANALEGIYVGVMHPHIVIGVLLDHVEARHANANEAQMVGVADARRHVASRT